MCTCASNAIKRQLILDLRSTPHVLVELGRNVCEIYDPSDKDISAVVHSLSHNLPSDETYVRAHEKINATYSSILFRDTHPRGHTVQNATNPSVKTTRASPSPHHKRD